jgi:hypothetical protein
VPDSQAAKERELDAIGGAVVVAIAAIMYVAASREPPAFYDPLGPGSIPMAVSALLGLLGLVLLGRAVLGWRTGQATQAMILGLGSDESVDYALRPGLAAFCFAMTAAYTMALEFKVPFMWATFVFLFVSGAAMAGFKRRETAWVLAASIAGTGISVYLFQHVLQVNLP